MADQMIAQMQPDTDAESSKQQLAPRSVMILAGEASSDQHTAAVVRALQAIQPDIEVFGMGGSALRAAGMETIVDSEHAASVMGLTEVVSSLRDLVGAFVQLRRAALQRKPDLILLVDFPDFNMLFARSVSRACPKIVYYISPQIWAWRQGRVRTIAKHFAKVLPIFPFEESFYHAHGVDAEFLGHPFLDRQELNIDRNAFLTGCGLNPALPVLALLPGSRKAEIERLALPMRDAWRKLKQARPHLQAVVPVAPTLKQDILRTLFDDPDIVFIQGQARELLHSADAAVVASGTATLEAALAGVPFVVVYRLSPFSYAVGKLLIKGVKHIAMANLILGRTVVPELIQEDANSGQIAAEVERYLGDSAYAAAVSAALGEVRSKLSYDGEGKSAERIAEALCAVVQEAR